MKAKKKPGLKVYYVEFNDHYMAGRTTGVVEIDAVTFAMMLTLVEDKSEEGAMDALSDLEWSLMESVKDIFSIDEMFDEVNGWGKSVSAIKRQLARGGTYSGQHEEGSHALSVVSLASARRAVAAIEAGVTKKQLEEAC